MNNDDVPEKASWSTSLSTLFVDTEDNFLQCFDNVCCTGKIPVNKRHSKISKSFCQQKIWETRLTSDVQRKTQDGNSDKYIHIKIRHALHLTTTGTFVLFKLSIALKVRPDPKVSLRLLDYVDFFCPRVKVLKTTLLR